MPDSNEAATRRELIDPALAQAGWDLRDPEQVRFEIPVDGASPEAWRALRTALDRISGGKVPYDVDLPAGKLPAGICDYALYRENGEILAIVEAKRTSIDPRFAQPQAEFYVREVARRQGFTPLPL